MAEVDDHIQAFLKSGFKDIPNGRGVSALAEGLKKPFDLHGKSKATATRRGVSQKQIEDEWEAKGNASRELGCTLHEYSSRMLRSHQFDPIEALSDRSPQMLQFDKFWSKASNYFTPIWIEQRITCEYYGVVGRIDALIYNSQTGLFHLLDWKTGSFNAEGWNRLEAPFSDLRDNSLDLGAIQLGIYRLAIEYEMGKEISAKFGDGYLIHVSDNSHTARRVRDYRNRLAPWLRKGLRDG